MSFSKKLLVLLPEKVQDRMLSRVIASGKWKTIPTFHMLFTSYEIMGADRNDLIDIFSKSRDFGPDLYKNCRIVAKNRELFAQKAKTQQLEEYQKSIMLYFLADWISFSEDMIDENYRDLLKVSAQMEQISNPGVEKVSLPWKNGFIWMRFRKPASASVSHPVPIILLFQGNDTVKETLFILEESFLNAGFAVLNVDQPGWGESRLSGTFYDSLDEIPKIASILFTYIQSRKEVISTRTCVCGFSGGATYAAMIAGFEPRLKCFISYGGGIYDVEKAIRGLPSNQKRQVMKHWGCNQEELKIRLKNHNFNSVLTNINAKTLIIHGEKDTLLPFNDIKKAVRLIPGLKDLHFVPNGDHMCSATMESTEIPFMLNWLQRNL
jgi:dipeptidyl aminopeptidase/acylaminoacyl peptidase